jgi:transposase
LVAADDKTVIGMHLSPGNFSDAAQGRELVGNIGIKYAELPVLMDKAYEDDKTRLFMKEISYEPVVPPKINRKEPWEYDKELYKQRNVVERLFRRIKGFRRIFTRYDKLDVVYMGFLHFCFAVIWSK